MSSFDRHARDGTYDRVLDESLRVSGESHVWFAEQRVAWLAAWLDRHPPLGPRRRTLDFGCGHGATCPLLQRALGGEVVGVDAAAAAIDKARSDNGAPDVRFEVRDALAREPPFDVAYSNGVFHHIPPRERASEVAAIHDALAAGGVFALWENNPGNPGTRYVMSRCAFDDDAVPVWPREARRLLASCGFVIEHTAFRFLFPAALRALRPLEPALERLPLGAQYVVVGRKRAGP